MTRSLREFRVLSFDCYGTLIDSNSRLFCVSDGGAACLIVVEGRIITQWEARAGFTIRF